MDLDRARELFLDYLEGRLPEDERRTLRALLENDAQAAQELEHYRKLIDLEALLAASEHRQSSAFSAQLMERIEESETKHNRQFMPGLLAGLALGATAVVAVLVTQEGVESYRQFFPQQAQEAVFTAPADEPISRTGSAAPAGVKQQTEPVLDRQQANQPERDRASAVMDEAVKLEKKDNVKEKLDADLVIPRESVPKSSASLAGGKPVGSNSLIAAGPGAQVEAEDPADGLMVTIDPSSGRRSKFALKGGQWNKEEEVGLVEQGLSDRPVPAKAVSSETDSGSKRRVKVARKGRWLDENDRGDQEVDDKQVLEKSMVVVLPTEAASAVRESIKGTGVTVEAALVGNVHAGDLVDVQVVFRGERGKSRRKLVARGLRVVVIMQGPEGHKVSLSGLDLDVQALMELRPYVQFEISPLNTLEQGEEQAFKKFLESSGIELAH